MFSGHRNTLNLRGMWDASTNTPNLLEAEKEGYYIVSVEGDFELDGCSTWDEGDYVYYTQGKWERKRPLANILSENIRICRELGDVTNADIYQRSHDEIKRLEEEVWQLKGTLGYSVPGHISEGDYQCGICLARYHEENSKLAKIKPLLQRIGKLGSQGESTEEKALVKEVNSALSVIQEGEA